MSDQAQPDDLAAQLRRLQADLDAIKETLKQTGKREAPFTHAARVPRAPRLCDASPRCGAPPFRSLVSSFYRHSP